LGELAIAHETPFQRAIRVLSVAPATEDDPTAQQSDAETHATPVSWLSVEARALGESTIDHELPSQRSISVLSAMPATEEEPTAQHEDAERQATPERLFSVAANAFGELTIDHELPFQRWMRV
jgi:hypothetical protein